MPIITLKAVNDMKLGKHPAKEVVGTKTQDGSTWKKAFFANNKELRDKLSDFEVGDVMNVVLEKNGEYYNIVDFKEVSDDEIEKAVSSKATEAPKRTEYVRPAAGGVTRGDDTNRSAAIYLAQEFVAMEGGNYTAEQFAITAAHLANNIIYPFIKDGKVPEIVVEKKTKKVKADPLAPPTLDE